ncbi:MAG: nucleotidyltransferase domain-containing protein [Candidatus Peregrinibacteria bacterium]|nr:nucleotidyltransferase domain-containing protein [Candidatus Peregrinibacteria bacterium]
MSSDFFSTSEARKHLSELVNQVKYQGKTFSIGRHGQAEAILMPVTEGATEPGGIKVDSGFIAKQHVKALQTLAEKFDLSLIILFGSQANGKTKPDSDIDLAVKGTTILSREAEEELFKELVLLFHRDDIDLVNLDFSHDVILRNSIFSQGKVLFESRAGLCKKYCSQAFFEYQDFKRHLERYDALLSKKLDRLIKSVQ